MLELQLTQSRLPRRSRRPGQLGLHVREMGNQSGNQPLLPSAVKLRMLLPPVVRACPLRSCPVAGCLLPLLLLLLLPLLLPPLLLLPLPLSPQLVMQLPS